MTRRHDIAGRARQITATDMPGTDISVQRDWDGYEITAARDGNSSSTFSTDAETAPGNRRSVLGEILGLTEENQ